MNIFLEQKLAAQSLGKPVNNGSANIYEPGAGHSQFLNLVQEPRPEAPKRLRAELPQASMPTENSRPQHANQRQVMPEHQPNSLTRPRDFSQQESNAQQNTPARPDKNRTAYSHQDLILPDSASETELTSQNPQSQTDDQDSTSSLNLVHTQNLPLTSMTEVQQDASENPNAKLLDATQVLGSQSQESLLTDDFEISDKEQEDTAEKLTDEPIFWLLTGQLQNLSPLSIPPLVLNNEFVQEAMEAANPNEFLNQKQEAGRWLEQLGLSPDKQAQILQYTMLEADQEISAHQLFKSMGLDPQNIGAELSQLQNQLPLEGLTPHMVRAATLQGQNLTPRTADEQLDETTSTIRPIIASPLKEVIYSQDGAKPFVSAPPANDPYQMIQSQWNPSDVQRVDFTATEQLPTWLNQLQDSMLIADDKTRADEAQSVTTESGLIEKNSLIPIEVSDLKGQSRLTQIWQAPQDINQDEVTLFQLGDEGLMPLEQEKNFSSNQEHNPSQSDRRDFNLGQNLGFSTSGLAVTEQGKTAWNAELQSPQIQRVRQEIISRAEMLIKEGGGSVKIDLNHQTLGKIDLAIDIIDQKIEIRIIAGSEKARELLAQELPRLRESLQNQDLDLQSIEIGLRQESQWSKSYGDGSQRQGETWQEQQDRLDGPWKISRSQKITQERAWSSPSSSNYHNGQIQVRV